MKSTKNFAFCFILSAAAGIRRSLKAAAVHPPLTNDFYRFNYTGEEMQPIKYPAQPITTQHQITLHGETIKYTAHVGFIGDQAGHHRHHAGPPVLHLLFEERT